MKVKLLKHIIENGGVKVSRRRRQPNGSFAVEIPFVAGAVIEMSDESAKKYIAAGVAEPVKE